MHRNSQGRRPALGYFVLASLLLHAAAVGLWQGTPPPGQAAQESLRVTLLARHGNAASSRDDAPVPRSDNTATTPPRQAPPDQRPARPAVRAVSRTAAAPVPKPADTEPPQPARPAEPVAVAAIEPDDQQQEHTPRSVARRGSTTRGEHAITSSARHSRVLAALQQALFPHFDYPPLARRRGWQGRVDVGLRIEADGNLSRIRLVASSGHALLDRAAVKNVSQLRSVPAASQWLGGRDMEVVLPVLYQLRD